MAAQVALVTGSNSGLGKSLTLMLAKQGYKVWAGMRNLAKGKELQQQADSLGVASKIRPVQTDVCSDDSVKSAFKAVQEEDGRLDVLVNNAGYSLFGSLEMVSVDQCKDQFETNFFGVIRCTQSALPMMRGQKSGKIIYISSVGGVWGQCFNDVYCASKFALAGMAESQAALFREMGIHVSLVQPGGIKSAFIENAQRPDMSKMPAEYMDPIQRVMKYYTTGSTAQSADEVAQAVMDQIVSVDAPPLRVQTNPLIAEIFEEQLADPTGETAVKLNAERLLGRL